MCRNRCLNEACNVGHLSSSCIINTPPSTQYAAESCSSSDLIFATHILLCGIATLCTYVFDDSRLHTGTSYCSRELGIRDMTQRFLYGLPMERAQKSVYYPLTTSRHIWPLPAGGGLDGGFIFPRCFWIVYNPQMDCSTNEQQHVVCSIRCRTLWPLPLGPLLPIRTQTRTWTAVTPRPSSQQGGLQSLTCASLGAHCLYTSPFAIAGVAIAEVDFSGTANTCTPERGDGNIQFERDPAVCRPTPLLSEPPASYPQSTAMALVGRFAQTRPSEQAIANTCTWAHRGVLCICSRILAQLLRLILHCRLEVFSFHKPPILTGARNHGNRLSAHRCAHKCLSIADCKDTRATWNAVHIVGKHGHIRSWVCGTVHHICCRGWAARAPFPAPYCRWDMFVETVDLALAPVATNGCRRHIDRDMHIPAPDWCWPRPPRLARICLPFSTVGWLNAVGAPLSIPVPHPPFLGVTVLFVCCSMGPPPNRSRSYGHFPRWRLLFIANLSVACAIRHNYGQLIHVSSLGFRVVYIPLCFVGGFFDVYHTT